MLSNLAILEFPSNLGLKSFTPGLEPGVKKLPEHLRKNGLHEALYLTNSLRLDPPPYSMNMDAQSGVRNADQIVHYAQQQAIMLRKVLKDHQFPLILGGDCSILIGNALCLKKMGSYALFFLDGHTDYVTSSMSQTGGAAGMDLAIVSGNGHDKLTDIDGLKPYFKEEHIWCVGNRYYDPEYVTKITGSTIHYTSLHQLRQEGINKCLTDFLNMVRYENLDGFWLHIDVDVLNDRIMPAVDSRQPDGLEYAEFNEIMHLLLTESKATGVEITILDPDLDPSGVYAKEFVLNFCPMISSIRSG